MVVDRLENEAPIIYGVKPRRNIADEINDLDESIEDPIDQSEIFDYIRDINDPEHPYTLEQLNVVQEGHISVGTDLRDQYVDVKFTPTIPHCSMATLIGLAIYVKLRRSLSPSFKILVHIAPGTHSSEEQINRQLADKERVAAAMENINLMQAINKCLSPK